MQGVLTAPGYRASYTILRGVLDAGFVAIADELLIERLPEPERCCDQPFD